MALILVIGLALRVLLIVTTRGTSDLGLWELFVATLQKFGVAGAYGHERYLNHPPLGALVVWGLHAAGPLSITLRSAMALADVATTLLIAKIAERIGFNPRLAAGLFFLSPIAILTSSLHCNTDALLVALIAAAVLLLMKDRPAIAGVVFACACGIKIVPALAFPLLVIKGRARFAIAYVVVCTAIFIVPFAHDPFTFVHNVAGYAGSGEMWGLSLPATIAGAAGTVLHLTQLRAIAYGFADVYDHAARFVIIAIVLSITWIVRKTNLPAAITLCFLGAIVAAPRVSPGYFLWFLPMLPFAISKRLTLAIHAAGSLHLAIAYTLYSASFPWTFIDFTNTTNPPWLGRAVDVSGVPLWILCIVALVSGTRAARLST